MTNYNVSNDKYDRVFGTVQIQRIGKNRTTMEFIFRRIALLIRDTSLITSLFAYHELFSLDFMIHVTKTRPFHRNDKKSQSFFFILHTRLRKKPRKFETLKFFTLTKHLSSSQKAISFY